jgi:hypothetical protein
LAERVQAQPTGAIALRKQKLSLSMINPMAFNVEIGAKIIDRSTQNPYCEAKGEGLILKHLIREFGLKFVILPG